MPIIEAWASINSYPNPSPSAAALGQEGRQGRPAKIPSCWACWAMHTCPRTSKGAKRASPSAAIVVAGGLLQRKGFLARKLCVWMCGCWVGSVSRGVVGGSSRNTCRQQRTTRRSFHGSCPSHPNHAPNNRSHSQKQARQATGGAAVDAGKGPPPHVDRTPSRSSEPSRPEAAASLLAFVVARRPPIPLQNAIGEKSSAGRQIQGGCNPPAVSQEGRRWASFVCLKKKDRRASGGFSLTSVVVGACAHPWAGRQTTS